MLRNGPYLDVSGTLRERRNGFEPQRVTRCRPAAQEQSLRRRSALRLLRFSTSEDPVVLRNILDIILLLFLLLLLFWFLPSLPRYLVLSCGCFANHQLGQGLWNSIGRGRFCIIIFFLYKKRRRQKDELKEVARCLVKVTQVNAAVGRESVDLKKEQKSNQIRTITITIQSNLPPWLAADPPARLCPWRSCSPCG